MELVVWPETAVPCYLAEDNSNGERVSEIALLTCPREPKDAYLLGLGTGVSLASILRFDLDRVDLCEVSPEVVHVAKTYFDTINNQCMKDPRVHLSMEDGRHWMGMTKQNWESQRAAEGGLLYGLRS